MDHSVSLCVLPWVGSGQCGTWKWSGPGLVEWGSGLTALKLIGSVLAVFLSVAQPHAGDAVSAGTREVSVVTRVSNGRCGIREGKNRRLTEGINHWIIN